MPYFTKEKCVYKKSTGKQVGCTKGSVKKYIAALHANVKESINECMDYKDIITDKETEASVYYTLTDDPSTEIGLVFNLTKNEENKLEADYAFGVIKSNKNGIQKFVDPLEAKEMLSKYGIEPDDIERRGKESYEIIEDEMNSSTSSNEVKKESVTFNTLYNNLMKS